MKADPRGLGKPKRAGQPHAMTPAARATETATSTGPANALMVTSPARARTAIVTKGCNSISGTGSTAASAAAAARFCARVNVGGFAFGFADLSGLGGESCAGCESGLSDVSGAKGRSGVADESGCWAGESGVAGRSGVADHLDCAADSGPPRDSGLTRPESRLIC